MDSTEGKDWLRDLLAVEKRPGWLAFSQRFPGQIAMAAISLAAVYGHLGFLPALIAVFGTMGAARCLLAAPHQHMSMMFFVTWTGVLAGTILGDLDTSERILGVMQHLGLSTFPAAIWATVAVAIMMPTSWLLLAYSRSRPASFFARRPFLALLLAEFMLCTIAVLLQSTDWPFSSLLCWTVVIVLAPYLWFLPYAVNDLRSRRDTPITHHVALQRSLWSPTYLPFGKGLGYLRRHQAGDQGAMAITQTKGLKLLLWANVLDTLRVHLGEIPLPSVEAALDAFINNNSLPAGTAWGSLILSTARFSLQVAVWAHVFVGLARMAGYRIPRGSWRPLESRTLMDYFNRFHYYFKEVLVDFFFTPTFFKVFKNYPRFRMFFATFMAAGVGNALWHFARDIHLVGLLGPARALETFTSYLFYCGLLATAIGISQLRLSAGVKPSKSMLGWIKSFLVIWPFLTILHVFSIGSRSHALDDRIRFLGNLMGII